MGTSPADGRRLAVGRVGHGQHVERGVGAFVGRLQARRLLAVGHVPEADRLVPAPGDDRLAVLREDDGPDLVLVPGHAWPLRCRRPRPTA